MHSSNPASGSLNTILNDKALSYGDCPGCKKQRSADAWCKICDTVILKDNFRNWASGSSIIDEFIRHTQLNANESMDYLEWIDFDQFDLVEIQINELFLAQYIPQCGWKAQDGI